VTDENESFFQEVDESLTRDRTMDALRKYGPWLAGAFVAGLVGLGGWLWYQDHNVNQAQSASDKLLSAQQRMAETRDFAAAATAFDALSKEGPQTYRVLAMMERGAALEAQGDLEAAIAAFDAAATASKDDLVRDTARIRAAYLVADTQDFAALRARLDPMIQEGGSVSFLARELLGVEAWEAGDTALARDTLENLNLAFDAPESVRQRVGLALAVLPPAAEGEAAAPAEAPAAPAPNGDAQ
jgi:hypothetical protein